MKTLYEKALECERAGEFGKAYELLLQCVENGHDAAEIAYHCAWCVENGKVGGREHAVRLYEQAAEQAVSPALKGNAFFRAGWLLLQEKEHAKAAAVFKKVVSLARQPGLNHDLYHQALFWYAVSLEHLGYYLDAARFYDTVKHLSANLSPESAYRKIICCNQAGNYDAALEECSSFPEQGPHGFDPRRYSELFDLIKKEEQLLRRCLSEDHPPGEEA